MSDPTMTDTIKEYISWFDCIRDGRDISGEVQEGAILVHMDILWSKMTEREQRVVMGQIARTDAPDKTPS